MNKPRIPLLQSSGEFRIWKARVLGLLQSKGLGGYATGVNVRPTDKLADTEPDHSVEAHKLEFNLQTKQALSIIKNLVHPSLLPLIEHVPTPKAALDALSKELETVGVSHFLAGMTKLFSTVKKRSVAAYLAELDERTKVAFPDINCELDDALKFLNAQLDKDDEIELDDDDCKVVQGII